MEYLTGGELFAHLKSKGIYDEVDAIRVTKQLLCALDYMHGIGIIHRDLKPENLIFSKNGNEKDSECKIADFGLATLIKPDDLEAAKCGSPGYVGNSLSSP